MKTKMIIESWRRFLKEQTGDFKMSAKLKEWFDEYAKNWNEDNPRERPINAEDVYNMVSITDNEELERIADGVFGLTARKLKDEIIRNDIENGTYVEITQKDIDDSNIEFDEFTTKGHSNLKTVASIAKRYGFKYKGKYYVISSWNNTQ